MLKIATKFSPVAANFDTARQAGFQHAEIWLSDAVLSDWRSVADLAGGYPLGYVLHFPNQLRLAQETLAEAVELYRALDCQCMVIHQPQFNAYAAALAALDPNVRLAVENHKLTPQELERWAETNPGLTLDFEHVWKFTLHDAPLAALLETTGSLLKRWGNKLRHVHLPGYVPGYEEHRPMYCSRDMVFSALSLLNEINFGGFVVSESNLEYQTVNDLRMDLLLCDTWRLQQK